MNCEKCENYKPRGNKQTFHVGNIVTRKDGKAIDGRYFLGQIAVIQDNGIAVIICIRENTNQRHTAVFLSDLIHAPSDLINGR